MPRRHHFYVDVSEEHLEYLRACARIRDIKLSNLFSRLLVAISEDQLVFSILDDNSEVNRRVGEHGYRETKNQ